MFIWIIKLSEFFLILVLFGKNATGKTNILKALENVLKIIKKGLDKRIYVLDDLTIGMKISGTISEAATSEGIKPENQSTTAKTEENYSKDNNKISDGAVIAIVFSVIILGFAGLVFISRK